MRLRLTITLLTLLSCTDRQKGETKKLDVEKLIIDVPVTWQTLDFKDFTIQVPETWQQVRARGIDSFVGQIVLDKGDTASFDLGWYSNPLDVESIFINNGDVFVVDDESNAKFYGKADTVDVEQLKINKIKWAMIDGKLAKIVQPKQTGKGMTGVYFDSLWTRGSETDRFEMNGTNLDPDNERRLLQAFATLKFKK